MWGPPMAFPPFDRRALLVMLALAAIPSARADAEAAKEPVVRLAPMTVRPGPLGAIGIQCSLDVGGLFGKARIRRMDISLVTPGSAAERAGLKAGDGILKIDGVAVNTYTVGQLRDAVTREKGDSIVLEMLSPGAKGSRPVELTLGARSPTPK
jgi:C-terminal processing protease CtpA/Prc